MDFYDEETGFTAMERTTGWDGAIVAGMMARGQTPRGAAPVETAVPPVLFVEELAKRGIQVRTRVQTLT
jgi:saccharopine dehydrogenase-like NADP-dependent oxidoreductase